MKREELNLQNPPKKYRPYPFWSWNSELNEEETSYQIEKMNDVGMGGFFMHARGGLTTPYMGDEWFKNIEKAIDTANKTGLEAWAYDENGWPSGFGSGKVNGKGEKYHQKYLYMEFSQKEENTPRTLINKKTSDGKIMHFFYGTNPYYVDCMDSEVTKDFINEIHEVYKEKLGEKFKDLKGMFTDEPQLSRREKSIPYSLIIPYEYKKEYNEEFFEKIEDLFIDTPTSNETRFKFFRLVTRLFAQNFLGVIYDWCDKNNLPLTGHMVLEETLQEQLDSNGSCMPNYMYFHIPGVDKLGRSVHNDLLSSQVTSVGAQMGREQILSESFALCGWDVTFEDLKWIIEWQMVRGVNLLCQHLSPYSLKGIRKRDYPAGHMYQNPWWDEYKVFNDLQSRIGYLLAKGKIDVNVLVLHPESSAWLKRCDNYNWKEKVHEENTKPLYDLMCNLDKNQILFHLGDESVMEKIANVKENILNVGKMSYKYVILPRCETIFENTYKLLKEFSSFGGKIICIKNKPTMIDGKIDKRLETLDALIIDSEEEIVQNILDDAKFIHLRQKDNSLAYVTYAKRDFDDFTMYYFVNSFEKKQSLTLTLNEKNVVEFNYLTGEEKECEFKEKDGKVTFDFDIEEKGSKVFFAYKDRDIKSKLPKEELKEISLNSKLKGEWKIEKREPNAFVLDFCDLYIDGKLTHKNIPVVDVQEIANDYKKEVEIKLDFFVNSDIDLDDETFLVLEEEEFAKIYINDKEVIKDKKGYFRDKAFTKLDITSLIKKGENKITFKTNFSQSKETYDIIDECYEFEAMKNKLTYEREIDAMYILGNFSVEFDKEFTFGENDSLVNCGKLKITKAKDIVTDGEIVTKGYPFFTGKITLSKEIELTKDELFSYIEFEKLGSVVTKVYVNGKLIDKIFMAPYKASLKDALFCGKNKIEIELISNFRNLLGPLHLGKEDTHVCPFSFLHNSPIYARGLNKEWQDSYAFIKTGIFFK